LGRLRTILVLAVVLLSAGCARAMSVGSADPTQTYSIAVENRTDVAMIVSYNDGRGDALLGNVAASATERFVIAGSTASTIHVTGAAVTGTRRSGPHTVALTPGQTVTVVLR
jgi:hypothetical protein